METEFKDLKEVQGQVCSEKDELETERAGSNIAERENV